MRWVRPRRDSNVGTFGDIATLSFYPAHHITTGRRRSGPDRQAESTGSDRIVPRLGTRLLVRTRQGQHLRQAFRLATGHPALRLRSQIHLFAHRLQPEGDRYASRARVRRRSRSCPSSLRAAKRIFATCIQRSSPWKSSCFCRKRRQVRIPPGLDFPLAFARTRPSGGMN